MGCGSSSEHSTSGGDPYSIGGTFDVEKPPPPPPPPRITAIEKKAIPAVKARGTAGGNLQDLVLKIPSVKEYIDECRDVYKKADKNGDGNLSFKELDSVAKELKFTEKEGRVKEIYKECDFDSNKKMDFEEFLVYMILMHLVEAGEKMETEPEGDKSASSQFFVKSMDQALAVMCPIWNILDGDANGYVDTKEAASLAEPNQTFATRMFHAMDVNDDGKITLKEYLHGFETLTKIKKL